MSEQSDSPNAPAPNPPGDFTTSTFFTSPSTYLTLVTYLLPLLNLIFGEDVSAPAEAVANAAPIIATAVLLVMRNRAKVVVTEANLELAKGRMAFAAHSIPMMVAGKPVDLQDIELRLVQIESSLADILVPEDDEDDVGDVDENKDKVAYSTHIPRTKSGKIDGRTAAGKAAIAAGME